MPHQPKKSFSQNFLTNEAIVEHIAEAGKSGDCEYVIEIGAGEGALTAALAKISPHIITTELDRDLIPALLRRFPLSSNVSIVEGDILHMDIAETLLKHGWQGEKPYAIFGNIPYGITGKIVRKIVETEPAPKKAVLMVQKEVAERITEKDRKSSLISLAVSLWGKGRILFSVPKTAFFPVPNVESAIIELIPNSNRLENNTREHILRLAKIGFASKRKTLANNFASHPEYSKETIERFLESIGKPKNVRAEKLSAEEWMKLAAFLTKTTHSEKE